VVLDYEECFLKPFVKPVANKMLFGLGEGYHFIFVKVHESQKRLRLGKEMSKLIL
jgi:hypothetical protein